VSTNPAGEIQATPLGEHAEATTHGTFDEPVGKRSPILGYNHNVRYRGLVFHVQTEDSGVLSPHLFTHLFHHGVIVSTRKLDYDAGSAEDVIKSLMQAQHKAVLKELRRGQFDDKIDSYLGGTPGLLPRGVEEVLGRASETELAARRATGTVEDIAAGAPTDQVGPMVLDEISEPMMLIEKAAAPPPARSASIPPAPPPRANTRQSVLAPGAAASGSASSTLSRTGAVANPAANPATIDTTLRTAVPAFEIAPEPDLSPEIEIHLVDDGDADEMVTRARRVTRDTETVLTADQTRPTAMDLDDGRPTLDDARRGATLSDGVPSPIRSSSPAIPPPLPGPDSRRLGDRPSTINAATLPAPRPISRPAARPQAMGPPQVVSRPLPPEERRRPESEAVEVYSPAPASAELPHGERSGQYAQHKKGISGRIPIEGLKDVKSERSAGVPIPAGLGRPQRSAPVPGPPKAGGTPVPPPPPQVPSPAPREPRTTGHTEPLRGRVPTPARLPVPSRSGSTTSSGVVMTRPAVIVGAPQKSAGTVPRIRKAREDEGRGFGQGLISEKSLDEVILAYLSEDADEK
jgi:hypothetical protein